MSSSSASEKGNHSDALIHDDTDDDDDDDYKIIDQEPSTSDYDHDYPDGTFTSDHDGDLPAGTFSALKMMVNAKNGDDSGQSDAGEIIPHGANSGSDSDSDCTTSSNDSTSGGTTSGDDADTFDDDSQRPSSLPQSAVGRYFSDITDPGPTCHNCGKPGHLSRECGEPSTTPCFLCGQLGHVRNDCPSDLCYNCLRPGHQSRDCPQPKRRRFIGERESCNQCGLPGHLQRDCSLAWRQYVFCKALPSRHTVNKDVHLKVRPACYNCASGDHFGDECPSRSRFGYSIFHTPVHEYLQMVAYRFNTTDDRSVVSRNMTLDNRPRSRSPRRQSGDVGVRGSHRGSRGRSTYRSSPNNGNSSHHHSTTYRPSYRGGYNQGNK